MEPMATSLIGNDILDLGSRSAEVRARRQRDGIGMTSEVMFGMPGQFDLPCVPDPAVYCRTNFASVCGGGDEQQEVQFAKGTTTLAFKFKGGVIVSVDSRSSMGSYISSSSVHKVIRIHPYLLGTMAGGAADCMYWQRHLGMQCRLYELRNGRRITVAAASKILANIMNAYRGYGLSMGTMIAGWDETGPQIYYVDNDGTRLKGKYFSQGSGSTFAYGILDTYWREDLTVEEAIDVGKRAIYHATHRDSGSGGFNNLYFIDQDGWKFIHSLDVNDLHYEFQEEKANAMT